MRTLFLIAFSLLATPLSANEPKSVSIKTISSIQRAIVPVVCAQVNGEEWTIKRIIGTGFFINRDGYFLTAGHVVANWEQINLSFGPCVPAIYIPEASWSERSRTPQIKVQWFRFSDCKYSRDVDVAVCKPILNPFTNEVIAKVISPLRLGNAAIQADGSPVAFTGFPLGFHVPVTSKGYVAAYAAADKKLIIDKSAWPGASGSPVYDAEGKVIGLVIETGLAEGAGLTYSRPVDLIREFLAREKIAIEN